MLTLIKLFILVAALVVISVGLYLAKRHGETRWVMVCDYILVGLAGLSLMNYFYLMPFSFRPHYQEMFHYYVGSKYFPEVGYTRLYACVVRAEAESDDLLVRALAPERYITDLETDNIVSARPYSIDNTFCKSRFSASRWNEFKGDISFFHSRLEGVRWNNVLMDLGFNPSPVWELAGGHISNSIPLSDQALMRIKQIDVVLILGSIVCLVWAFGLPTTAFAVISFAALDSVVTR